MGLKAALSRVFAAWVSRDINRIRRDSVALQQKTFEYLIAQAKETAFCNDHQIGSINTYEDF